MAYSKHKEDRDQMLTCCVCFEPYIDPCIPKNLECGHVCCKECLKQILIKSTKKGFVQCPECRHKMHVPGGKIENLSTNFPLKNLAEHEQKQQRVTPAARRNTLRRRVTMLRERESQAGRQPQTGQQRQEEEEMIKLRLQIECLEQQLQHQQSPNSQQAEYMELDSPQETETEVYQQMGNSQQESDNSRPLTPPSLRPLPSPPVSDRHRLSLPIGSRPSPEYTGRRSVPNSPQDGARTLPTARSFPDVATFQQVPKQQAASQQVLRKELKSFDQFGSFEQAQGIAVTPDGLLAVCDFKAEIVRVFQRKKGKYQKKFDLKLNSKNPNKPADVAVTTKGKFLVARRTAVELYSSKGKYERAIPNYQEETLGLCTVATVTDGRILVGDISHFNIIIYEPRGEAILQTLNTETKPARIAALKGTLIAVSHARLGRLEIFDSALNQSIRLIEIPEALGMCHDPYTNSLLVVRNNRLDAGTVQRSTGVVEQYSIATGLLTACLAEELFHPFNLTFTANGILAVADKWTIKLFQVRDDDEPPIYE